VVEIVDVEPILFATDYPHRPGPDGGVGHFLHTAGLDRIDQERIAARSSEALVRRIRR
jgi:hypothetical protein